MDAKIPSQRVLSLLVLASLSLLALLSSSAGPPEVAISDLAEIDSGEIVVVVGVVVDEWSSDTGSDSLVLADYEGMSSVKCVRTSDGLGSGSEVGIGDEVRLTGEVEVTGGRPLIWTSSDGLSILRPSREVVTIGSLENFWPLLVGDRFEIKGVLCVSAGDDYAVLRDPQTGHCILLRWDQDVTKFVDRMVIVDCTLRLDPQTMRLMLQAHEVLIDA